MPGLNFTNLSLNNFVFTKNKATAGFAVLQQQILETNVKSFGYASDSDDNSLIIGSYAAANAKIYEYNSVTETWVEKLSVTKTGRFGFKVAINGNWAAVSNIPASGNGSIFMYRKVGTTWSEFSRIDVPTDISGLGFGTAVAISGNTMVIGHRQANNVGGAHVYEWNGTAWVKQIFLSVTSSLTRLPTNQSFGVDVAIDGDFIVVGGSGDFVGKSKGMAFISHRNSPSWSQPQLIRPVEDINDGFGWSVKVKGTTVVVGAPYGLNATNPGRVFVYDMTTNSPVLTNIFKIINNSGQIIDDTLANYADSFGWSVSLTNNENVIAVGSLNRNGGRGIVYLYEKVDNVWGKAKQPNSWVLPYVETTNARFGSSVTINANGMFVGAYGIMKGYWFK